MSTLTMRFFDRYVPHYLGRRFHRVHFRQAIELPRERPLLFAMSHASWWDVLVGYHLARHVVRVDSAAPMDAAQLARYPILGRLGLYGVERGTLAGRRAFLRDTVARLRPGHAVWITPQGEIVTPRRRPVRFQHGVGHVVCRVPGVAVVPVAVIYEFLDEPRPEIFIALGAPRVFDEGPYEPRAVTRRLERELEQELDALDASVQRRELAPFTPLLDGDTSISLVYDRVRALRRWWTSRPDPPRHGDLASDPRRRRT